MTTPYLAASIERDEGRRLEAYRDSRGVWTIGVGHTPAWEGETITEAECERILSGDIAAAIRGLDAAIPWWRKLSDTRQDVLANMAFNLGVAGLLKFKRTLTAAESCDYEAAAGDMLESEWAEQVGGRAERLAEQMRTGTRAP